MSEITFRVILIFGTLGGVCLITGLLLFIPRCIKFAKCKATVKGMVVHTISGSEGGRKSTYEYEVDGVKYRKSTGWSNYTIMSRGKGGKECDVMYDPQKPERSYTKWSGQRMNCFFGGLLTLTGIVVLIAGVIFNAKMN